MEQTCRTCGRAHEVPQPAECLRCGYPTLFGSWVPQNADRIAALEQKLATAQQAIDAYCKQCSAGPPACDGGWDCPLYPHRKGA
jgi:hypothetical protein